MEIIALYKLWVENMWYHKNPSYISFQHLFKNTLFITIPIAGLHYMYTG